MRFVLVPFIFFLAASVSLAGAPTATIDPSTDYYKIDITRPPPPPTPVYVVNFPDVQVVLGKVSVENLPAVQAVSGTVNVGNLPLDAEGAMRVSSTSARSMVWYELISEPLSPPSDPGYANFPLQAIDTTGYSSFAVWVRDYSGYSGGNNITWAVESRWNADEDFAPVYDRRVVPNPAPASGGPGSRSLFSCTGGEIRLVLSLSTAYGVSPTVRSVRLYLFP